MHHQFLFLCSFYCFYINKSFKRKRGRTRVPHHHIRANDAIQQTNQTRAKIDEEIYLSKTRKCGS